MPWSTTWSLSTTFRCTGSIWLVWDRKNRPMRVRLARPAARIGVWKSRSTARIKLSRRLPPATRRLRVRFEHCFGLTGKCFRVSVRPYFVFLKSSRRPEGLPPDIETHEMGDAHQNVGYQQDGGAMLGKLPQRLTDRFQGKLQAQSTRDHQQLVVLLLRRDQ